MHSAVYIRVFLLGAAAACAGSAHGLREREDSTALLATVIRHGGEVWVCEGCGDEQPDAATDLMEGAKRASLWELSRWVSEADRLLVF